MKICPMNKKIVRKMSRLTLMYHNNSIGMFNKIHKWMLNLKFRIVQIIWINGMLSIPMKVKTCLLLWKTLIKMKFQIPMKLLCKKISWKIQLKIPMKTKLLCKKTLWKIKLKIPMKTKTKTKLLCKKAPWKILI